MLGTVMPTARISLVLLAAFVPLFAAQQTNTVAGEFVVEPPTFVSLGFDWKIREMTIATPASELLIAR